MVKTKQCTTKSDMKKDKGPDICIDFDLAESELFY